MKILNLLLILFILAFVVTGCTKQQSVTDNSVPTDATGNAGKIQAPTPDVNTPAVQDNNVTIGDNPDNGDVSAPDVDTTGLN